MRSRNMARKIGWAACEIDDSPCIAIGRNGFAASFMSASDKLTALDVFERALAGP